MSTQDQPDPSTGTSTGTSRLSQLASEDGPIMSDGQDPLGITGDPDAIDSNTGRRPGHSDSAVEAILDAGVAGAGGAAASTGAGGIGAPLLASARDQSPTRDDETARE